jgi:hypothetical protein
MLGGNSQGDVERDTFDPADRYSAVLMQQGRVQLAADSNEQSAIHLHLLRSLIVDLKGRAWRAGHGFEIDVSNSIVEIQRGHFYVDGVLCENEPLCEFDAQPFLPKLSDPKGALEELLKKNEPFGLYLDCWERHVSWLSDPRLREVALGGPDTATRLQVAWQVLPLSLVAAQNELEIVATALEKIPGSDAVAKAKAKAVRTKATDLKSLPANAKTKSLADALGAALDSFDDALPRMAAEAKRQTDDVDPCAISAASSYRGRENQLYRVEVHSGGLGDDATFKWSRDPVAFKVTDVKSVSGAKTTVVRLESLGRDRRSGLCVGDWVELADRDTELRRQPLDLLKVLKVDEQRLVTLEGTVTVDPSKSAILRRWDHANPAPDKGGALLIKESADPTDWVELERGVKIQFALGGRYQPGDYWLIPARVATGDIEWPRDGDVARHVPPRGVKHHRALLAILTKAGGEWSPAQVNDKPV